MKTIAAMLNPTATSVIVTFSLSRITSSLPSGENGTSLAYGFVKPESETGECMLKKTRKSF